MTTLNSDTDYSKDDQAVINQAKIERYKFILSELSRLNENPHRHTKYILAVFPAFSSAIIVVKFGSNGLNLTPLLIAQFVVAALIVMSVVSLFTAVSIVADIASWIDYRREEYTLICSLGTDFRKPPSLTNLWRWYETYLVIFIIAYNILSWAIYFGLF